MTVVFPPRSSNNRSRIAITADRGTDDFSFNVTRCFSINPLAKFTYYNQINLSQMWLRLPLITLVMSCKLKLQFSWALQWSQLNLTILYCQSNSQAWPLGFYHQISHFKRVFDLPTFHAFIFLSQNGYDFVLIIQQPSMTFDCGFSSNATKIPYWFGQALLKVKM